MGPRRRSNIFGPRTAGLLAAVGLLVAATFAVLSRPVAWDLVVCPPGTDRPLLRIPLESDERFTLQYIHSVDHSPVWEEHSVDREGTIFIEEERFITFGAGLGHWRGHGRLTSRGPVQVIESIHAPIGGFLLRIGSLQVGHTLLWRDRQWNLSAMAAGQVVEVFARPVSLLSSLGDRRGRRFSPVAEEL